MNILTLDFETYYDKEYSLSKMTVESYIRDPRFEVIGVSVKKNDEPAEWFSGTKDKIKNWLDQFSWGDSAALAHNAMFDLAILNWHFDIRPKRIADTLSMNRAVNGTECGNSLAAMAEFYGVGVKGSAAQTYMCKVRESFTKEELKDYGGYCCNDVELTYSLFKILSQDFPVSELKLIDLTIRMFSEPVLKLNVERLLDHKLVIQGQKDELMKKISVWKEDLLSNEKFATLLKVHAVIPPTKISKTTGKETWAFSKTDEEFLALQEHESPMVQALVAARLGIKSTLEETRTQRFIDICERGLLPIPLSYYAAHTGRWGGADKINLQNLPRVSPLKYAIEPPEGTVFCDSDSSQIECRVLAWLAGQQDLLDAFEKGEDVYKIMASKIYGVPPGLVSHNQRFIGKTVVLGCGYSLGWSRFQAHMKNVNVPMTDDEAKSIIQVYRDSVPYITQLWQICGQVLACIIGDQYMEFGPRGILKVEGRKGIRLPNGLYIKYPNLRWEEDGEQGKPQYFYDGKKHKTKIKVKIYGGKVVENICQALARIIIGEQMLLINKKYRVALTVHDSVGCLIPKGEESTGKEFVDICMRLRPEWATDLPLNCETGTGLSYGDC